MTNFLPYVKDTSTLRRTATAALALAKSNPDTVIVAYEEPRIDRNSQPRVYAKLHSLRRYHPELNLEVWSRVEEDGVVRGYIKSRTKTLVTGLVTRSTVPQSAHATRIARTARTSNPKSKRLQAERDVARVLEGAGRWVYLSTAGSKIDLDAAAQRFRSRQSNLHLYAPEGVKFQTRIRRTDRTVSFVARISPVN